MQFQVQSFKLVGCGTEVIVASLKAKFVGGSIKDVVLKVFLMLVERVTMMLIYSTCILFWVSNVDTGKTEESDLDQQSE